MASPPSIWDRVKRFVNGPASSSPPPAARRLPAAPVRKGARADYDGASYGRRTESWRRNGRDSNAELSAAVLQALRGIAREICRNNAYGANAANKLAQYLVGTGIQFHVYRGGVKDKDLTARARQHFESTSCDADGRNNLYGLQLLAAETMIVSGEVLVRRRWRKKRDKLAAPFVMQVLEPDFLQMNSSETLPNGGVRIQGVEFDAIGRRTGYLLWSRHPGSILPLSLTVSLVPDEDVAHVYRTHRPGAVHGESWFAPVIVRIKDFGEFADAQLVRQKIAACFAAFRSGDPNGDPQPTEDSNGEALDTTRPDSFAIEPGIIEDLPPGSTVTFADPPGVGDYEPFSQVSRQEIAAGLGLPYEVLTGDLSNVSFISGRIGRLDFKQAIETWQDTVLIPQLCDPAARWLLDAWELQGLDISDITVRWTPPRFPMMSPETEVPATRDAIRSGQQTLSGAARERGQDIDEFLDEMERDNAELDRRGIVLDSDPRKVTQVGNPAEQMTPQQMNARGNQNG